MTAAMLSHHSFNTWVFTLFIFGFTAVFCLHHDTVTVHPTTPISYHSTETTITNATGEHHLSFDNMSFDCGSNSLYCSHMCFTCHVLFGKPTMECLSSLLNYYCLEHFEIEMTSKNSTDWCIWANVYRLYNNASQCTENISDCLMIPWPNPLVERIFVDIHTKYFKDCPSEELSDPPPAIVFALVITPICLIPVMVSLVVLKTKNGDGGS
ncbi:receptor activity-modifying protein 2 [Pholidichthys leucotaenia]